MYIQSKSAALLILVLNEITLGRRACMQHGRGVVITAPPTVRYSEQILYAAILRRASHCVRYPELGGCPLFGCFICIVCMETAVGACNSVRYSVDVHYWECPLIESPLYTVNLSRNVWRALNLVNPLSVGIEFWRSKFLAPAIIYIGEFLIW